jgi:hypothetical protein
MLGREGIIGVKEQDKTGQDREEQVVMRKKMVGSGP